MFGQEQPITYINLHFSHSLRIPYKTVDIEVVKRKSEVVLFLTSKPANEDSKWDYSNKSEEYKISDQEFNNLLDQLEKINTKDIAQHFGEFTLDSYSTTITFGGISNKISYTLGSLIKEEDSSLKYYMSLCKDLLVLAQLDPDEIL